MIRAGGRTASDRPLVILGLDRENIDRLLANQPIRVDARPLGVDVELVLLAGETLGDVEGDLRVLGYTGPPVTTPPYPRELPQRRPDTPESDN